jgi:hypothetical protein
MSLYNELIQLSKRVKDYSKIQICSNIKPIVELSNDVELPYIFTCEALHPGEFKGFIIEEEDIILGKDTIFQSDGVFHNYEINKDHKSSRKYDSSVDDLIGKVISAHYDYTKRAYILTGEIYDKQTALKISKGLLKYVSLRINPQRVEFINGKQYARELIFEELSFVRAPGDADVKIY